MLFCVEQPLHAFDATQSHFILFYQIAFENNCMYNLFKLIAKTI